MDSAEFLDLLGNANRRRILQLLSQKPCYVTEISEYLGVSPKAVIDHLRKLEDAGLVESRTDERRRKYFSISRHVRLEVTVSPYEFGTKSAYPASSGLDIASCRHLTIELEQGVDPESEQQGPDVPELTQALHSLETLENELSLAQRWVRGRIVELREEIAETVDDSDPRLISEVLLVLVENGSEVEEISRAVDAPPRVIEDVLEQLAEEEIVYRDGHSWHLDS